MRMGTWREVDALSVDFFARFAALRPIEPKKGSPGAAARGSPPQPRENRAWRGPRACGARKGLFVRLYGLCERCGAGLIVFDVQL